LVAGRSLLPDMSVALSGDGTSTNDVLVFGGILAQFNIVIDRFKFCRFGAGSLWSGIVV
jgi:hypothetical protein